MTDDENNATSPVSEGVGKFRRVGRWIGARPRWVKERLYWCNQNRFLFVASILIVVALALVIRILFSSVEIGSPATESETLIRSSERLIQMVQWTVSTVLIIGGGLIGLNWYSNEHRYREDKSVLEQRLDRADKLRVAEFTATIEQSLALQKQILEVKFDVYQLTGQISSSMMLLDNKMPPGGYVTGAIESIRQPLTTDLIKGRTLDDIAGMFERESGSSSFTIFLGLDRIPELAAEAEKQGFVEKAERLRRRYRELKHSTKDRI